MIPSAQQHWFCGELLDVLRDVPLLVIRRLLPSHFIMCDACRTQTLYLPPTIPRSNEEQETTLSPDFLLGDAVRGCAIKLLMVLRSVAASLCRSSL